MCVCSHATSYPPAITAAPAHYCHMLGNRAITGEKSLDGIWRNAVLIYLLTMLTVNHHQAISYTLNQKFLILSLVLQFCDYDSIFVLYFEHFP